MSRYIYGRKSWKNPDSKYAYAPADQLDKDIKANAERFELKKDLIKGVVEGVLKSDPTRQDETFHLFIEVLKEIKTNH